ncbi:hypothetical protein AYI92_11630 [Shewanella xiamenensis]|uniref:hypothetical protein n=1 Tax=Shewanella TaxID=22 RepID=UPI0006474692|nr:MULTISPECIES: hypothetical protein [Shewanella]TVL18428.1 hypothetical protein AYI90_11990 [Shewanella xiamenensis]TVL19262.1 hypothetical protein AYI91_11605 [Shewanella xiamenensis]TVL25600.1 hypothetical protein AYI92_11630 [Shewanella xiamenensis]TVL32164.1 hypothetical protein AYI93_12015 [Shewanella xiamenensis]TVP01433.1 hypothetical protein AYI89_11350 [Shewanella xiamenensis]
MMTFQRFSLFTLLFCIGIWTYIPNSYAVDTFIINPPESNNDHRYQYTYDLLTLIIEATNNDFGVGTIQISDVVMSRNRIFRGLLEGKTVNVIAEASNSQWDEQLIPIKIPIRKGIQGFRVFIIKKQNLPIMANINTLAQLIALDTGSGSQWSSKAAMQNAGFNVIESIQYDNLFNMLSMGRFITFGRGVNEAFQEVEQFKQQYPDLVVDDNILLHIPLATYYYVAPNQPRLATRIQEGLKRIIANGKFDELFYRRHCEFLLKSNINHRRVFKINNPLTTEAEMTSIVGKDFLLEPSSDFSTLCEKYH